jgi:hypothetical protein
MTTAPATRLTVPVVLAAVVGVGDLVLAVIGWSAYRTRPAGSAPDAASWATIYVFGAEAAVGVLVLLLAVVAAGRSAPAATTAAGLAWLRLVAVGATTLLIGTGVGFSGAVDSSDVLAMLFMVIDALVGAAVCTAIARRTRRRSTRATA